MADAAQLQRTDLPRYRLAPPPKLVNNASMQAAAESFAFPEPPDRVAVARALAPPPFDPNIAGIVIKRNCSISPRGLIAVFVSLLVLSLIIAGGFALLGAWLIVPFSVLELTVLAAVWLWWGQHAADVERIWRSADGHWLHVARIEAGRETAQWAVELSRVRVFIESSGRKQRLWIETSARVQHSTQATQHAPCSKKFEVGAYFDAPRKLQLAVVLNIWCRRGSL